MQASAHLIQSRRLLRYFSIEPRRSLGTINNAAQLKSDVVLSEENRKACIQKLRLYRPLKKCDNEVSKAAVLVPICTHNGKLGLLYTLRSTKLSTNRGQVSFPGGMKDSVDKSFVETALRETWEELRIPTERIDVWTSANSIGRKAVRVVPVLGYIGEVEPEKLQLNSQEVEEAFVLSLEELCDPSLYRFTQFRDKVILPVYLCGNHRVWGLTAAITHMIMSSLVPWVYKHKLTYLQPVKLTQEASIAEGDAKQS